MALVDNAICDAFLRFETSSLVRVAAFTFIAKVVKIEVHLLFTPCFALSTASPTRLLEQRWKYVWGRVDSTSQTSTFDTNAIKLGSRKHFDVVDCS